MGDDSALDPRLVFTRARIISVWSLADGGNRNRRVWLNDKPERGGAPIDVTRRGDGAYQEGAADLACLGASLRGVGALRIFGQSARRDAETLLDGLGFAYQQDLCAIFGDGPYILQQGGPPRHRPAAAQEYCRQNYPSPCGEES